MEFVLKILKHFRFSKQISQVLLLQFLQYSYSRKMINCLYNGLDYREKKQFHSLFADMFRNRNTGIDGQWKIKFLQVEIKFDLSKDNCWLEWESALSILGHDIEVKETYEYLLKKGYVHCFFDIGANYGTHSILFLSQNIQTITFEPNPTCHKYFHELLTTNDLSSRVEPFALGEKESMTKLVFPEKETWLGKINNNEDVSTNTSLNQNVINVQVISLDSYVLKNNLNPDLIKIDTEGYEEFVILGAAETLSKKKPLVIFECNPPERDAVFELLLKINYEICSLPFTNPAVKKITKLAFKECRQNNFIAIHNDYVFTGK
jgi:FkbM family methyltransferase